MIDAVPWHADLSPAQLRRLAEPTLSELPGTADVVVIGGGLVGLFTAWELARRNVGLVLLLEAHALASGASSKNTGGLFAGQASAHFPESYRGLLLRAREAYSRLAEHSPFSESEIGFSRNGSLNVSGDWPGTLSEFISAECRRGNRIEPVCGRELRSFEPELATSLSDGFFCPDDATVHPLRAMLAVRDDLQRHGGIIQTDTRVRRLVTTANGSQTLSTSEGDVTSGCVVVTTGWEAAVLSEQAGCPLPIDAVKGQAVATRRINWQLRTNVIGEQMVRQLPDGQVIAGGTLEHVGPDLAPTERGAEEVIGAARRTFPRLQDVPFVSTWVGLRPHTPDDMPVIDRVPGSETSWIAAGHFTKGLLLAPLTGQLVAEWIVDGQPSCDLSLLSATRFSH